MGNLSKDFDRSEFACPCEECGGYPVDPHRRLVARLQDVRDRLGHAVTITSGVRCPAYNAAVGGVPQSEHVTGEGVDVAVESARDAFRTVEAALAAGFRRIGISFKRKFVHLGVSTSLVGDVLWGYDHL